MGARPLLDRKDQTMAPQATPTPIDMLWRGAVQHVTTKGLLMPRVCVFDVNETLLDLRALDPAFAQLFGDTAARREWFAQMIQSALVATVTGAYPPFGQIGDAALTMIAARRGVTLADDARRQLLGGMRSLPPHPDVRPALERLRSAGLRLAALTNSTAEVAEAQLANAGLAELFELRLSADALRAGCAGAFVARPGMVLDPLVPAPDVTGVDMAEVAKRILASEGVHP